MDGKGKDVDYSQGKMGGKGKGKGKQKDVEDSQAKMGSIILSFLLQCLCNKREGGRRG